MAARCACQILSDAQSYDPADEIVRNGFMERELHIALWTRVSFEPLHQRRVTRDWRIQPNVVSECSEEDQNAVQPKRRHSVADDLCGVRCRCANCSPNFPKNRLDGTGARDYVLIDGSRAHHDDVTRDLLLLFLRQRELDRGCRIEKGIRRRPYRLPIEGAASTLR